MIRLIDGARLALHEYAPDRGWRPCLATRQQRRWLISWDDPLLDLGTQNDGLSNLCQRSPLLLMLAL
jgi:hypothetical protein